MPRHLLRRTALATAGVAAAAALLPATAAAAAPTYVAGDVTGDGISDRIALADVGTPDLAECVAQVKVGRGDGTFAPVRTVHLDTPENPSTDFQDCPDRAIVLTGVRPGLNRLAAVYTDSITERGTNVYDLTGTAVRTGAVTRLTTFASGYGGQFGTADFDGDGNLDFYRQGTDQGEGSAFWQRRGNTFVRVYASGSNPGIYNPGSGFQFVDLNRAGGIDVLVSTIGGGPSKAEVVDGRTGAVQTLADATLVDGRTIYGYSIATVDLDHDRFPDVVVQPLADDGPNPAPRYFLNRSQAGRWLFTPYGAV